nr:MAG TPA: hypothetical protein [Caudoviricetes sp.]
MEYLEDLISVGYKVFNYELLISINVVLELIAVITYPLS